MLAALPAAAHTRTLSEPNGVLQPHLSSDVEIESEIALPTIITDAPDTLPVFTRSQKLASGFFGLGAEPNIQRTLDLGQESRQVDDYMHARYYNPNLGRFLSVDPGGVYPDRPQTWNRYAYVSNNPILKLDPDGRDEFVFVWKPGVDAVGHAAIGVQNRGANGRPDGTVTVRHLWPAEPVGKSLEAPADYRTDVINESDLMKFQGGEGKAADGILRIKGDAKQDGSVLGALAKADNNPKYTGPSNTCSTFCAAGVQATGIKMTQTGNVKVTVGGLTVKEQSGVITPIAVYNSVVSSKDPRVTVVKALPDRDPNLTIKY